VLIFGAGLFSLDALFSRRLSDRLVELPDRVIPSHAHTA
jgi:hypothetical protein